MTTALIPGSLSAIAKRDNVSLAESFANADVVIIVDVSGSMDAHDSRGSRSRFDVACEELAALQNNNPGRIAVLSFSSSVNFVPDGKPLRHGGSTDLVRALQMARMADTGDVRFVIISDGEPDDPNRALSEASRFIGRIDVVYVGPEDRPFGRDFLTRLAASKGGVSVTADRAFELAAKTQLLLSA